MTRAAGVCGTAEDIHVAVHTTAPKHIAPHLTLRPWNSRAALQIMPTAMNRKASAIPEGNGGETALPSCNSAPDDPPIRYAMPHQASAWTRSCIQANKRKKPSNAVTHVAITISVSTSSEVDASARRANMTPMLLTSIGTITYHGFWSRAERLPIRLCQVCPPLHGFVQKTFENCARRICRLEICRTWTRS